MLPALFIGFFVLSSVLRAVFGRVGGAAASAGLVGIVVWVLSQVLMAALGLAVLGFLLSLVLGLRSSGWSSGGRGGFGGFGGFGRRGLWRWRVWRRRIRRRRGRFQGRRRLGTLVMNCSACCDIGSQGLRPARKLLPRGRARADRERSAGGRAHARGRDPRGGGDRAALSPAVADT